MREEGRLKGEIEKRGETEKRGGQEEETDGERQRDKNGEKEMAGDRGESCPGWDLIQGPWCCKGEKERERKR